MRKNEKIEENQEKKKIQEKKSQTVAYEKIYYKDRSLK